MKTVLFAYLIYCILLAEWSIKEFWYDSLIQEVFKDYKEE